MLYFKRFLCFSFIFLVSIDLISQQNLELPNIIWIVSEDNSPFLGAYGDDFATTPNLDKLASEGILYLNAFATAPVCAPARSTLITGVYPTSMGTEHMRSTYPIPSFIKFFPKYLKEAGYYTSNNAKKDYNTIDQPEAWDESSNTATYKNRKPGQPFFSVFNLNVSHESSLHTTSSSLDHDPEKVTIPPYHPETPEMKHDWAQYYDYVQQMDAQAGDIIKELEAAGLADNTIVFYYSDHGGVLGRSKRFLYESGLHIPLIIRFPPKFQHLAPDSPGSKTDRIVTFADFAPTILNLAGIPVPDHMQGRAFLGQNLKDPLEYAMAFRGRMDERIDLSRTVRDKKYRYIKNYMPHKIYGQYIAYLWKAPSMQSWEDEYKAGNLNETQSRFWNQKPAEELYDVEADPHNINNLAGLKEYEQILNQMREANRSWIISSKDVGFIPEAMMVDISETSTMYEYARSKDYALEKILETAELASSREVKNLDKLLKNFNNSDAIVRYWAATGCTILGKEATLAIDPLLKLIKDSHISVQIAAAEALYHLDQKEIAIQTLKSALQHENKMVRLQALNVLEQINEDARQVFDQIKSLTKDDLQDQDYDARAANRIVELLEGN
ncbi:sulfatase [soil metagenome]